MALQKTFADSPKSWRVDAKTIDPAICDLSVKNPNGGDEGTHRTPQEIMKEIAALDKESEEVLENIKGLLKCTRLAQSCNLVQSCAMHRSLHLQKQT